MKVRGERKKTERGKKEKPKNPGEKKKGKNSSSHLEAARDPLRLHHLRQPLPHASVDLLVALDLHEDLEALERGDGGAGAVLKREFFFGGGGARREKEGRRGRGGEAAGFFVLQNNSICNAQRPLSSLPLRSRRNKKFPSRWIRLAIRGSDKGGAMRGIKRREKRIARRKKSVGTSSSSGCRLDDAEKRARGSASCGDLLLFSRPPEAGTK